MAKINVIQPKYGEIIVLDSNPRSFTVKYEIDDEEVEVNGFNVFCNACGQYLYHSSNNPSTFDIQALIDTGHPGDFDISADVRAPVEFSVRTFSMDESMGTATPTQLIIPTEVGKHITFTISATPKDGYRFVKWVSSTGGNPPYATTTIGLTVKHGDSGRIYYAYFEKIPPPSHYVYVRALDYDRHIDSNGGKSGVEGIVTAYYENPYSGVRINIARLHTNKIAIEYGHQVTMSVEMLQSGIDAGYKFYGWTSDYIGSLSPTFTFVPDDHDYSFKAIFIYGDCKTVRVKIDSKLYGYLGTSADYSPYSPYFNIKSFKLDSAVSPEGSVISGQGSMASSIAIVCPSSTVRIYGLNLYLFRYHHSLVTNTFASNNAFVHGASSSKVTIIGEHDIEIENPDDGDDITIYLCTHLLVHKPDGQNLESKPQELLYDCNMPQQSQQS